MAGQDLEIKDALTGAAASLYLKATQSGPFIAAFSGWSRIKKINPPGDAVGLELRAADLAADIRADALVAKADRIRIAGATAESVNIDASGGDRGIVDVALRPVPNSVPTVMATMPKNSILTVLEPASNSPVISGLKSCRKVEVTSDGQSVPMPTMPIIDLTIKWNAIAHFGFNAVSDVTERERDFSLRLYGLCELGRTTIER